MRALLGCYVLAFLLGRTVAAEPANYDPERASAHLSKLVGQPWLSAWKEARVSDIRLVEPKNGGDGSQKKWWAKVEGPNGASGHLCWAASGDGLLEEFAFDAALEFDSDNAKAIKGVPNVQQFPIVDQDGAKVASGCVPTAGASVVGFWMSNGFPQWRGSAGQNPLLDITERLRGQMRIEVIPDTDGFVNGEMSLAGASPLGLYAAILADAKAHNVALEGSWGRGDFGDIKREIESGSPVLLSCYVPLPQKPELSWPHQVVGVGWARVGELDFVGIVDNFFPTKSASTIRWIRATAFNFMLIIRPQK